jgi:hypothetical protein
MPPAIHCSESEGWRHDYLRSILPADSSPDRITLVDGFVFR